MRRSYIGLVGIGCVFLTFAASIDLSEQEDRKSREKIYEELGIEDQHGIKPSPSFHAACLLQGRSIQELKEAMQKIDQKSKVASEKIMNELQNVKIELLEIRKLIGETKNMKGTEADLPDDLKDHNTIKVRNITSNANQSSAEDPSLVIEEKPNGSLPKNCYDIQENGDNESGVRSVYPFGVISRRLEVICDQETEGGGWTVVSQTDSSYMTGDFDSMGSEWRYHFNGAGNIRKDVFWFGAEVVNTMFKSTIMEMLIYIVTNETNIVFSTKNFSRVFSNEKFILKDEFSSRDLGELLSLEDFQQQHIDRIEHGTNTDYKKSCFMGYSNSTIWDGVCLNFYLGKFHSRDHIISNDGINWSSKARIPGAMNITGMDITQKIRPQKSN